MPEAANPPRCAHIRTAIHTFIKERLDSKLEKLQEDDPKRTELIAQYQPAAWLEDAARRVRQIQTVTHSLKPIHPDARGTNLYIVPEQLPLRAEVGSHSLGEHFSGDVVGNAAALDVYKFLKLDINGGSLLDALLAEDADTLRALDENADKASQLRDAFVSLTQPGEAQPASHPLAKQLYWLVDEEPTDDAAYHLLAPLYATSLAHFVYTTIQEDRFGEANTAARQAYRENKYHEGVLRDYPQLAVQKLGGTKPQNISQLNSERRGHNYLLSCAPPVWRSQPLRRLHRLSSLFSPAIYGALPGVGMTISALRHFLEHDPRPIAETRNRRDEYIDTLIDELVQLASRYQTELPAGWSLDPAVNLDENECLWLDPRRAEIPEEIEFRQKWLLMEWPDRIRQSFARWVNSKLEYRLPVGDIEFRHWKKELLLDERPGGWAGKLHELRKKLEKMMGAVRVEVSA